MVSTNFWLYHLSRSPLTIQQKPTSLGIYAGLAFGSFLLVVIRCYLYFQASLRCSTRLYGKMVDALLQTNIQFFDTNPAGRILNRLSKDIGCVDEMLPETFLLAIQHTLFLCAAVLLPCITNFWIVFMVLCFGAMFGYYSWYYLKTSRELRRLESICRTPVYSHFSETISGLDTIRTQRMEHDFIDQFYRWRKCIYHALGICCCQVFFLFRFRWLRLKSSLASSRPAVLYQLAPDKLTL